MCCSGCYCIVESEVSLRSDNDRYYFMDECSCSNWHQKTGKSTAPQTTTDAGKKTVERQKLSKWSCSVVARFLGLAFRASAVPQRYEPAVEKSAIKYSSIANSTCRAFPHLPGRSLGNGCRRWLSAWWWLARFLIASVPTIKRAGSAGNYNKRCLMGLHLLKTTLRPFA